MDTGKVTAAMIRDKYGAAASAFCRTIPDARVRAKTARELDEFMRGCAAGVWARGAGLAPLHVDAMNAICSKGSGAPAFLYWELTAFVAAYEGFRVPDFFREMLEAERDGATARRFIGFFSAMLLLFAAADDGVTQAEADFITQCCDALSALCTERGLPPVRHAEELGRFVTARAPSPARKDENRKDEGRKAAGETAAPAAEKPVGEPVGEPPPDPEALLAELDALCGLAQVKRDVRSLINLVKVRRLRQENGLPVAPMSLHLVFLGNPGTGKTTVARLLARIYHAIGILSKGQLVEVDRSGLVAGYVGQTAIKTGEVLRAAAGGVLFIDEAYALASQEGANDFGREAVEVLLKGMEDNRDDLIVIVAGYSAPMERFIRSNPGLESRFNRYFHFEDYNGAQLFEIFLSLCEKNGYAPDDEAKAFAERFFEKLYETRDENFGNARDVRNLFERAVSRQSDRVSALSSPTREALMRLTCEDLRAAEHFYADTDSP